VRLFHLADVVEVFHRTLTAAEILVLRVLNMIGAAMPLATWRSRPLIRARERLARTLGMRRLRMTGTMPSGHAGTLMRQQMYYIDDARAALDGTDLGPPVSSSVSIH
jgi:hypothetical protein